MRKGRRGRARSETDRVLTYSARTAIDGRCDAITAGRHGSTGWQVKDYGSTGWQVKDSNLRSIRDGFTVPRLQARDQRKRITGNNFRPYSPQTADVNHLQPDNPAGQIRPTRSSAVMLEIALHLAFTDPQTLRTSRSKRTSRQSSSTRVCGRKAAEESFTQVPGRGAAPPAPPLPSAAD